MTTDKIAILIARIILGCIITVVLAIAGYCLWYMNGVKIATRRNFIQQIGTYALDMRKTKLGGYAKDSLLYKKLRITFREDSTFHINFQVPFIYDTVGKWNTEGIGLDDYNHMYYRKWGYSKFKLNKGDQFTHVWAPDADLEDKIGHFYLLAHDSTFTICGCTSQDGREWIKDIWFTKLSRQE